MTIAALRSLLLLLACAPLAAAQALTPELLARGVPTGNVSPEPLQLSLGGAIERGLTANLAVVASASDVRSAAASRLQALSALLPHAAATVRQSDQVLNTAAFGFTGFGDLPSLIGPFPVFDARVALSAPLFDAAALHEWRAERAMAAAAQADDRRVREIVVLAVGNVYLQALADGARVESARSQRETAQALVTLAEDQHAAGLVARIDVLRQQTQLAGARARLIDAENLLAKRKLQLARAIGLPAGQAFELSDRVDYVAAPEMTEEAGLAEALEHRQDVRSATARVDAARQARQAAASGRLPSLRLDTDLGALGTSAGTAERTYTIAASVHVPIFEGGRTAANVQRADAALHRREAELADATVGVRYDLSAALLDVKAAAARVEAAAEEAALAREALTQAQDRFRAGVASSIELVQAQEAVTRASEHYIASVYGHNLAKIELARALGEGETRFLTLVGGHP
ncbi:MAG: TolC family protein [Acidobacteria bacterium]|nr:TolC family protein [Acidobacteriota bacterium]